MFTRRIATLAAALFAAITIAGATAGTAAASPVHHSAFRAPVASSHFSPHFFR